MLLLFLKEDRKKKNMNTYENGFTTETVVNYKDVMSKDFDLIEGFALDLTDTFASDQNVRKNAYISILKKYTKENSRVRKILNAILDLEKKDIKQARKKMLVDGISYSPNEFWNYNQKELGEIFKKYNTEKTKDFSNKDLNYDLVEKLYWLCENNYKLLLLE